MLGRITLYTKDVPAMVAFYGTHFGFETITHPGDRITELRHPEGGAALLLHQAAKSQKMEQTLVKLTFDVADVAKKRADLLGGGVTVGRLHDAGGYSFANLKDPSGNAVAISSRFLAV